MGARWAIEAMIVVLSVSVVMVIWPGVRRFLLGFLRNGTVGLCILWIAGAVLGAQFEVGLNPITGSVCGLLGLPGTVLLLVLKGFVV